MTGRGTKPALADRAADCGHLVRARHALVERGGKWVCTGCSLPKNTVYEPHPCLGCAGPLLPGQDISLRYDGHWVHARCAPAQVVATARIVEPGGAWAGKDHGRGATERGEAVEGAVWGVHDYVPSYTMTVGTDEERNPDWTRYDPGRSGPTGCGWYRIVLPLAELARHGWRTAWRAGVPPQAADGYRVVTAQRLDKPQALPIWRRLVAKHRLVYETDDDIFSVPPERWSNASYPQHVMWDCVEEAARIADLVTVSVEPLAEIYRKRVGCQEVRVLPNSVPGALLTMDRARHRRRCVVGYQAGGSHGPDVDLVAGPLSDLLDSMRKKVELHMVGSDFSDRIRGPVRLTEWVPAGEDLDYYRAIDFDIGLAPLRGTRFDTSKSAIKAIEYMALGIPVLASDTTPYRGVVVDGVNGYLCRTEQDWSRRLRELAADPAQREELGAKGRQMAAEHTIEHNWPLWAAVYKELT